MARPLPHIGDFVRVLNGRTKRTAKVIGYLTDVRGGCRLDDRLDGFQCWNKDELEIVPASTCAKGPK